MIRAAQNADAGWIAALWNRAIVETEVTFTTEPKTEAGIATLIAARGPAFLVCDRQVGFATYGPFRAGPGYARTVEHAIYVDPAAQGGGAGTGLMAALEAQARGAGHHAMVAAISGSNETAIRFHARCGFRMAGRLPEVGFKNGRWLDLVLMTKCLDSTD